MHRSGARTTLAVLSILAASQVLAGGIAIVDTVRTDDGDGDGFADTKETVSFRLMVQNTTGVALTGVTAELNPADDALACVSVPAINIGNLAVAEIKLTDPFVFAARSNLDRNGLGLSPYDDLSVTFAITFSSQSGPVPAHPPVLALDLDLDVAGGADPTSYFETFEGELGTFEVDNMDQNLYSLAASDGYRCQDSDPDWANSRSYGNSAADRCFLGVTPEHAGAIFWALSGPAFSPLAEIGETSNPFSPAARPSRRRPRSSSWIPRPSRRVRSASISCVRGCRTPGAGARTRPGRRAAFPAASRG